MNAIAIVLITAGLPLCGWFVAECILALRRINRWKAWTWNDDDTQAEKVQ